MITKWAKRHSRNRGAMRSRQQDGAQDAAWDVAKLSTYVVEVTFDRPVVFIGLPTDVPVTPLFSLSVTKEYPASYVITSNCQMSLTYTTAIGANLIVRERYMEDIRTHVGGYVLPATKTTGT